MIQTSSIGSSIMCNTSAICRTLLLLLLLALILGKCTHISSLMISDNLHSNSHDRTGFIDHDSFEACISGSSVQSTGRDDKPYFISTIAGTGSGSLKVNVPALEAKFGGINGMVQSKNGDIFAVVENKHVVLKFEFNTEEGTWSNVTIIAGTGTQGKGADGVAGTASALYSPAGLSLIENSSGDVTGLLIAEWDNHRIRQLDMSTQIITTIAGTGDFGFAGDSDLAKDALLSAPRHAYYDKLTGDIFIADTNNNRIRRVSGGIISTVVGKTCTGSDGLGDNGQAVDACLISPWYFTMNNAGEWFIADNGNLRIRKVDSSEIITTVAGGGTETGNVPATSVKLSNPEGIAFLSSGEMLVADVGSDQLQKVDKDAYMRGIAGGGSETPSFNNPIPATSASIFQRTVTNARDGGDTFFVSDNRGYIYKLTSITKCYGIESDNSAVCSGHGSCISLDECECDSGWMGLDCSITHCFGISSNLPNRACSGKGKCVRPNKCHCEAGYRGHKCHRPINSLMMQ